MKKEIKKILCRNCKTETNHSLEWSKENFWDTGNIQGKDTSEILICKGCETITYRTLSENSEDFYMISHNEAEYDVFVKYYPPRGFDLIEPIYEIWKAPQKVRKIYQETIDAFNNKQPILCSIGIRSVIEAICNEEGITKKYLNSKIDELENKRIINPILCAGLHQSRIMGNDGAHRSEIFSKQELKTAINLVNKLIDTHYSLPEEVKKLETRKPKIKK